MFSIDRTNEFYINDGEIDGCENEWDSVMIHF